MIKTNKHEENSKISVQDVVNNYNIILQKRLIPDINLPIYGNSFNNPNDDVFHQPLKKEKWQKITQNQNLLEFKLN